MPSNVINAKSTDTQKPMEVQDVEKEFFISVFFDGTNNKMEYRQDGTQTRNGGTSLRQKDTNVAALSCLAENKKVRDGNKVKYYYHIYIEGPGTTFDGNNERGWFEKVKDKPSEVIGLALGTWNRGVIAKVARGVSNVHRYLNGNTQKNERPKVVLHFCIYGFSRGAACARLFAFLVARAANDNETLAVESSFKGKLDGAAKKLYTSRLTFLDEFKPANRIVEFLGIYDTVSSIGIIDETGISSVKAVEKNTTIFHNLNARDYGLYSPQLSNNVNRTFHICAMDEFRKNFAVTDVGKKVPEKCIEVFVPGCHSDVGGSYEDSKDSSVCLRYINNFKWTKLVMKDPRYPEKGIGNVNKKNLMALGWAIEKAWYEDLWDGVSSLEDNILLNTAQATVSYTRTVKRGLSNITFVMMWNRTHKDVSKVWGGNVFNDYFPLNDFIIPDALSSTAQLMDANNLPTGERSWIIPGKVLDSSAYRNLRSNYIHFSATDRLGYNIVNAPNWKDNLLCRIVYHGDRNDSGIHYMQDYDQ